MVSFGIIGAGEIARKFMDAVRQTEGAEVVAIASKSAKRAEDWAIKEGVPTFYGSYDALLADPHIHAVYIATTTNAHYENILQCLHAGKHVLCEKSLVRSYDEAKEVCQLAEQQGLLLMEAMWTRFLPKTKQAKDWIRSGRIGKVQLMQASIGWKADPVYNKRLFDPALGGGSLYDLGIYPLELLPYLVDQIIEDMHAFVVPHATGVDDLVSMNLKLSHCLANLQCSFTTKLPEDAYIYGEDGYIRLPKLHYGTKALLYNSADEIVETFDSGEENGFCYEVQEMIRCIENGLTESPICPHSMTLDAAKWTSQALQQLSEK